LEIWWNEEPSDCFVATGYQGAAANTDVEEPSLTEGNTEGSLISEKSRLYPMNWLLNLDSVKGTKEKHPMSPLSALLSLAGFYLITLIFVVFLSESIGILIRFSAQSNLSIGLAHMVPSLALAIPLAVRMLAQFEYPHAKHFSLVIPLMMIVSIFYSALQIASQDALPFLAELWNIPLVRQEFIRTTMLVSFVPVFIEAIFWMLQIFSKQEKEV
jgi:hypothetical protein